MPGKPATRLPRPAAASILDRWSPLARKLAARACECPGCRKRRARERTCKLCGYRGLFLVYPCECRGTAEDQEKSLQKCSRDLREAEAAGDERRAAWLREAIADVLCYDRCACGTGAACAHGLVQCPVCLDGSMDRDEDEQHPWRIIRALRRELTRGAR